MNVLIVGGTLFLGRAVAEKALTDGHTVALFNRGKTNPDLFPEVEHLLGDRDNDLAAIEGRNFDAVIDTCAYFPRQVDSLVDALGDIGHYTMVSSISVYADTATPGIDETAELAELTDDAIEGDGAYYGAYKAACERIAESRLPGRVHNVRAGLIVGPHDNTGRFSYWVERIALGGEVLAPEPREQPVQFIDVRDVAEWILVAATTGVTGAINATSALGSATLETTLHGIRLATGADADFTWVDDGFLVDHGVEPWSDLPLWLPMPSHAGFLAHDTSLGFRLGLTLRPLEATVQATIDWLASGATAVVDKDFGMTMSAGISAQREAELLAAYKSSAG